MDPSCLTHLHLAKVAGVNEWHEGIRVLYTERKLKFFNIHVGDFVHLRDLTCTVTLHLSLSLSIYLSLTHTLTHTHTHTLIHLPTNLSQEAVSDKKWFCPSQGC